MASINNHWSKEELHTYILLLCANADENESKQELELIKSKTDPKIFDKIYTEFQKDSEDEALEKIDDNVQFHHYSSLELSQIKKDMRQIFMSDKKYNMMEENLDNILDNIIY